MQSDRATKLVIMSHYTYQVSSGPDWRLMTCSR